MAFLIIQPSSKCDGACLSCKANEFSNSAMLPLEALENIENLLGNFKFRNCYLICPNPLFHPKIEDIIKISNEISKNTTLFMPISTIKNFLRREYLGKADYISLFIPSYRYAKANIEMVKMLISQGIENIEAYIFFDQNTDFMETLSIIQLCQRCGLKITIGPVFYSSPATSRFVEYLEKRKDVEIGLHYGKKYFYNARKVFIEDYPVTILTSCSTECKSLYIDVNGKLKKCINDRSMGIDYEEATKEDLRKLIFSPCPMKDDKMRLSPRIQISFVARNGIEISGEILELLEFIYWTGSFRAACRSLGVSPSTYWEKTKNLERKLGVKLFTSVKGGKKKGSTILTEFSKKLLEKYREAKKNTLISFYR